MSYWNEDIKMESLIGKTFVSVTQIADEKIVFVSDAGEEYTMYHSQDCCESVSIEDVCGDLNDLVGSPILRAEERSSSEPTPELAAQRATEKAEAEAKDEYYYGAESETWTFYEFATNKGSVTIRWYGTSNGYYSESVSFEHTNKKEEL